MKCPKCKLTEMIIKSVEGNIVKNYCRNCGEEYILQTQEKNEPQESI